MSTATYVIGDVRDTLAAMPDGSVDLVLTSPPFLALRSYLPADHPDKHREIGSEPTPAAFIDTLLALSAEWRRVLAPHGSICIELGDTYAGSGGGGGDYLEGGRRAGQAQFAGSSATMRESNAAHWRAKNGQGSKGTTTSSARNRHEQPRQWSGGHGWPMDKSLTMIPELYRLALGYGVNPLTGQASPAGQWRVRNVVRWCRPNPPVGALGDKFRPGTSDMVIACPARDRYFDLDAVRGDPADVKDQRTRTTNGPKQGADRSEVLTAGYSNRVPSNENGAPPLDWWQVSTEPYAGSHYATWPRKLLERPIKAMCPLRVCLVCGEPSRRITETTRSPQDGAKNDTLNVNGVRHGGNFVQSQQIETSSETIGWTDCGHDAWRPGVVLDPFAGSGTTLLVATGHGRDAIGIDFDARNADLATERIGGLFLTVQSLDEFAGKTAAAVGGI